MKQENVLILGASDKLDRYSYQALKLLKSHGHTVFPVNPRLSNIEGINCFQKIVDVQKIVDHVDTVTVYVSSDLSTPLANEIIDLKPGRVIFNPGSENSSLAKKLDQAKIPYEEACTLVLLRTGQY